MMAVRNPNDENTGIGAKPKMTKPAILDTADATSAVPVPPAARRNACIAGKAKLVVDQVLPMAEVGKAHQHLAGRGARGKVILTP